MKPLHPQKKSNCLFYNLDFQLNFNEGFFVYTVFSILKDCFFGLLFESVTTNQIDRQVHNTWICKMEADPGSVVFSLFFELPHIIQKENDLWDCLHDGRIAVMDFDWDFMILPFI